MTTRTKYWVLQCLGWGAYCTVGLWETSQDAVLPASAWIGYGLFFFYSIGLTEWLRQQIRARHWLDLPPLRLMPRIVGSALAIGTIQASLVVLVDAGFHGIFWPYSNVLWLYLGTTNAALIWIFLYIQLTAKRRQHERDARVQLALRDAELRALESQINPHFLFNCLNSIRALVTVDPPRAQDMVTRLANVMRYSLRHDKEHTVALSDEVEAVSDYLALEAVRFEERLQVTLAIDPSVEACAVPPMLLQTLVENAIKHGVSQVTDRGDLIVRAARQNGNVKLEVENTGQLSESSNGMKLGLANARERLRLLYGDRARLDLQNGVGSVTATVVIPAA